MHFIVSAGHVLYRAVFLALSSLSTTAIAVIFAILVYGSTIYGAYQDGGWPAVTEAYTERKFMYPTVVTVAGWLLIIVICVITVIYNDHARLIARNKKLSDQITRLENIAIYPAFRHASELHSPDLGKVTGLPEPNSAPSKSPFGAVQSGLLKADLVFLNDPCATYILMHDKTLRTYPCNSLPEMSDIEAGQRFHPAKGQILPMGGLRTLFANQPGLLESTGLQTWECSFPNGAIYSQRFENGIVVGPFRRWGKNTTEGRVYILINKTKEWDSDDHPSIGPPPSPAETWCRE